MAIQFARIEIVGRSSGGSACCKGAYNARDKVKDEQTGITYNFQNKKDNVYHAVLLPEHADKKFSSVSKLMNEIEKCEKRKDSQLLKDIVLALPDDKELTLEDRINITHLLIEKRGWVKEGLGVQVDIHKPHDDEKNWHAHLLVTTRRFTEDGLTFGLKATDLNPEFKKSGNRAFAVPEADQIHEDLRDIVNDYFKMLGLENRVDAISQLPQEHIGPVRMRSILNQAAERNEAKQLANIEQLNSGQALINRVSANRSVFNEKDLQRELKCIPDDNRRSKLFSEALESSSLVALCGQDGSSANYYTTHEIRLEEQKIIRLSGYVFNEENVVAASYNRGQGHYANNLQQLISDSSSGLSDEQGKALSNILLDKNGLRILRGRAGTGKSYVLGQANSIASNAGINVIGLAPTHKAKLELRAQGFERVDTIKGMLFGLAHGRFDLPKNSLLVVDEAGMIGNDDMSELLRVAATRKCNVILSGDERQLASVSRGGMFEVLADKYGSSSILDIKRQDSEWGKSVAMAMSEGNAERAVSILEGEKRIKWGVDAGSTMTGLLADWNNSNHVISDRLILAVKNKDVAALNHGARQYLKSDGTLKGEEIAVDGNYYMQGDRILITKTDKNLGLVNGDLAVLTKLSTNKFTCNINDKEISFNPTEYNGFRHGYATTIFKAQGASIKDVYVYHDGFSTIRNSYVSLSRHIDELRLYVNKESPTAISILTRQLANDFEHGSSLRYMSVQEHKELAENKTAEESFGKLDTMLFKLFNAYEFVHNNITKLADKHIPVSEYYNYQEPDKAVLPVEKVLDQIAVEQEAVGMGIEDKIAVGDNNVQITSTLEQNTNTTTKSKMTAKERFYANVDHSRNRANSRADLKQQWDRESHELREATKFKAEQITRGLLGDPNNKLSNKSTLRYGEHGKLAVRISGDKAGTWYDFSKSEGGDIFSLVQDAKNTSFKEAAEYLKSSVGMNTNTDFKPNLQLVYDHANSETTKEYIKEKNAKISYANKLYNQSKPIGNKAVASSYLTEHRSISCKLSSDINTTGIYDHNKKEYLPALIAFARDKEGNITGGQHILLDKATNAKAAIDVPKKSFGVISGSFVDLGNTSSDYNHNSKVNITIIAEGLETGLSVKQGLSEHNQSHRQMKTQIICSLGISNIKNYQPSKGEKLIIAADNDGTNSITQKTIEHAKIELEQKGAFVEIAKPEKQGDFNDVLKDKENGGSKKIAQDFSVAIDRHSANTLTQYFASDAAKKTLSKDERDKIRFISKFKVNEEKIVDAYRTDPDKGKEELGEAFQPINFSYKNVKSNRHAINAANIHGAKIDIRQLVVSLVGKSMEEIDNHILCLRDEYYIYYSINDLIKDKDRATTPEKALEALKSYQDFLARLHDNHPPAINGKQLEKDINLAYNNQNNKIFNQLEKLTSNATTAIHQSNIVSTLKNSNDSASALKALTKQLPAVKSFHCPVQLSFTGEIDKDTRKTIESLGMKFNKFRQEWRGNVEEHHVRPLTKSIEHYKHNIYVAPKEEISKSPEKANHNAIKIDRGFSM